MPNWTFHKLDVKGQKTAIATTTHVNTYGERFIISNLEAMVAKTNGNLMHFEHQYNKLPIGRIVSTRIVQLEGNEYGCETTMDLFVNPDSIEGMGLSVASSR